MDENMQRDINRRLYNACLTAPIDYSLVESLLRSGADPMGIVVIKYGDHECPEIIYDEVVDHLFDNEDTPEDLYTITELFIRHGMDLAKPSAPDIHDDSHPMWMFAFYANDCVLRVIKLFLDHGLNAKDAEQCWGHALSDLVDFFLEIREPSAELFYDCIRKMMLIASYPHILEEDEYLKAAIWFEQNQYDLKKFRNWHDFRYEISTPDGEPPEVFYGSVVTIFEKETEKPVWRFGVCLYPENYPELWLYERDN